MAVLLGEYLADEDESLNEQICARLAAWIDWIEQGAPTETVPMLTIDLPSPMTRTRSGVPAPGPTSTPATPSARSPGSVHELFDPEPISDDPRATGPTPPHPPARNLPGAAVTTRVRLCRPASRRARAYRKDQAMHDDAVRIEHGYHLIDATPWVRQRTSEPLCGLTAALREFSRHPVFAQYHPQMDTSARMQLWAAARGWTTSEETSYYHDHNSLSEPVSIVLAVDPDQVAYALVQVGSDAPEVLRDLTTDADYWLQVEPVDIVCPAGHRWTWLDHTSLLDAAGSYIPFADLFGRGPGAPYAECRDCLAYDTGQRDELCPCDSRDTIYCPTCQQRCRLQLTAVPTLPGKAQR